jgi:hypothetical protein
MKTKPEDRRTRHGKPKPSKAPKTETAPVALATAAGLPDRGSRWGQPPAGMPMRYPKVGPPVPVGYLNVEEWGLETGRGKVAAYAAIKRGEVETEDYGVTCIREDWRERNAARAAAEAEDRRRRYLGERDKRRLRSSAAASGSMPTE